MFLVYASSSMALNRLSLPETIETSLPGPLYFSATILKDANAIILAAAEGLGLSVRIIPVYPWDECIEKYDENLKEGDLPVRDGFLSRVSSQLAFQNLEGCVEGGRYRALKDYASAYDAGHTKKDKKLPEALDSRFLQRQTGWWTPEIKQDEQRSILWCNKDFNFSQPSLAYVAFGNEARADCVYSAAAILIDIPPFRERLACSTAQ